MKIISVLSNQLLWIIWAKAVICCYRLKKSVDPSSYSSNYNNFIMTFEQEMLNMVCTKFLYIIIPEQFKTLACGFIEKKWFWSVFFLPNTGYSQFLSVLFFLSHNPIKTDYHCKKNALRYQTNHKGTGRHQNSFIACFSQK